MGQPAKETKCRHKLPDCQCRRQLALTGSCSVLGVSGPSTFSRVSIVPGGQWWFLVATITFVFLVAFNSPGSLIVVSGGYHYLGGLWCRLAAFNGFGWLRCIQGVLYSSWRLWVAQRREWSIGWLVGHKNAPKMVQPLLLRFRGEPFISLASLLFSSFFLDAFLW